MGRISSCLAIILLSITVQSAYLLENKHVSFSFSDKSGELLSIANKATGRRINFSPDGKGLWQLRLLAGTKDISTVNGSVRPVFTLRKTKNGQTATLKWNTSHRSNRLAVEVNITLPDHSAIAELSAMAKVDGNPADWIENLVCPRLTGIQSLGDDMLYYGFQQGVFARDPIHSLKSTVAMFYPGTWSIPLAVYSGSEKLKANHLVKLASPRETSGFFRGPADDETALFVAAPDAGYYHKDFFIVPGKNSFSMIAENMPSYPDWPRNPEQCGKTFSYAVPYQYKLGTYDGGIGRGAELFREFVKDMPHTAQGKIRDAEGRANGISPRLLENVYWGKYYHAANKVVPEILDAADFLQVPCGLHWYRYYVNMFDDNNLDYLPTMPFFREGVEALTRQNILVAPYVCFAMWDPDTESFRRKGMLASALRERDGGIKTWVLAEGVNYWMNPASKHWRDEYVALSEKLFGQFGVNAQYIDVLPTASKQAYDPALGTIHGGNYWSRGNTEMLRDLHRSIDRFEDRAVILGEGFSDDSLAGINCSYLMGSTAEQHMWPLYSLIYHDYSTSYGSDLHQEMPADHYRWGIGRMFQHGSQLSLSSYGPVPFANSKQPGDVLLKNLAQAWYQAGNKFLNGGRGIETAQVPDPALVGRAPVGIVAEPISVRNSNRNFTWHGPALLGSSWEAYDNTVGITIANISGVPRKGKLVIQPEFLKPTGSVLYQTWPLPVKKVAELSGGKPLTLELEIPADQGAIFELAGTQAPTTRELLAPAALYVTPSTELKGEFPVTVQKGQVLYGSGNALLDNRFRNGSNAMTLRSEWTREPFKVSTYAARWSWFQGRGAKRPLNDVGFHLLEKTPLTLSGNGSARIYADQGVVEAKIEMVEPGTLKVAPGTICLIRERDGQIQQVRNEFRIPAGKTYFLAAFPETLVKLDPQSLEKGLAALSYSAAAKAEKLLTGAGNLPNPERREAELQSRIGNAAAYLLSKGGARVAYFAEHDWLIPMNGKKVRFINWDTAEKVIAESVKILNSDLADNVTVTPLGRQTFDLRVNHIDAASNLLRVFYSLEVENPAGVRFKMTKLRYEEVAEPILVKLNEADAVNRYNEDTRKLSFRVRLRNVSNDKLTIRVSAELPGGWSLATYPNFEMPPLQEKIVELAIERKQAASDREALSGKFFFNYTDDDSTRHEESFTLLYRSGKLAPVKPNASQKQWNSNLRRRNTQLAVLAESDKISLEVTPGVYTYLPDKLTYTLLNSGLTTVGGGEVEFKEKKPYRLDIPVPAKGVYFLKFHTAFAHYKLLNIRYYGYLAEFHDRYHFNGGTTTLYFYVKPGAEFFEFAGLDGNEGQGTSEPGGITIVAPDGSVRHDRFGAYSKDVWNRIDVPEGCDGKAWKVIVRAVDDFDLTFRGSGVSPYVAAHPESLITDR